MQKKEDNMQNESRIEMEVPKCFHSTIFYNYKF